MENRNTNTNVAIAVALVAVLIAYLTLAPNKAPTVPTPITQNTQATSTVTTNTMPTSATTPTSAKTVTIETNKGTIVFEMFPSDAPKTVENFATLAQKGFYDGVIFHRVIDGFMIQGGDPTGTGMGGPGYQFADELNPSTPSYKLGYQKGMVAMANAGPNTNGSQFFIMLKDTQLPHSYTIFGRVISGQDVVDAIGKVQVGANDKPVDAVVMRKVTVK
ncbi:MAG: peptidylprolyl isomerase [Patescibacteria group bacterium]|mgnify:CR=1 FL=1